MLCSSEGYMVCTLKIECLLSVAVWSQFHCNLGVKNKEDVSMYTLVSYRYSLDTSVLWASFI